MNNFDCPNCQKTIMENNDKTFKSDNNIIIKSRLVFLNSDGAVMCRCPDCKNVISLPLEFVKSSGKIQEKNNGVIDI